MSSIGSERWSGLPIVQRSSNAQAEYYVHHSVDDSVIRLARLPSRTFGCVCEHIIKKLYHLQPSSSVQHDATFDAVKIEIKSARYWRQSDDCRWQHIEPSYDYDWLWFVLLDFDGFKVWRIPKATFWSLDSTIVERQGRQGYWVRKSRILPFLEWMPCPTPSSDGS